MDRQFEERLRQSLQARATDVRPDPRTWEKVQRRIDRQRTFRFATGAALATAAVVGVIVVGPSLLNGPFEVDLERGAPADQTADPEPTAFQTPGPNDPNAEATAPDGTATRPPIAAGELGFVVTDGASIWLTDETGAILDAIQRGGEDGPIQDLAVRPNDAPGQLTVVWRAGSDCARLFAAVLTQNGMMELPIEPTECPGAPVFSPDGTHLAWSEFNGVNPSSSMIRVAPWLGEFTSEQPIVVGAPSDLPVEIDDGYLVGIDDWVWSEGTAAETAGFLALKTADFGREPGGRMLRVERRADGAVALPPGADAQPADWVAYAHSDVGVDGIGPEFSVTVEDGDPFFAHSAGEGQAPIHVDDHQEPVDGTPQWWVSALGHDVLVGDGRGRAWRARWGGGPAEGETSYQLSAWEEIPGRVVHAEAVALEPEGDRQSEPAVEPLPAQEGLPHEVEEIRQAIAAAARAGDIDQLVMLTEITDQFITRADGTPEDDPRAFFTDLHERGELEQLATILEFAYGIPEPAGGPVYYVWPYAAVVEDLNSLSSAQLQQLEALAGPDEVAQWEEFGSYIGPRIGIEERGAWRFYILGGD